MIGYDNFHQKISSGSAVHSGLTLFSYPYALSVVDTCRYGNLDLLAACDVSGSVTVAALVLDHLAGASALGTGLDVSYSAKEGLLGIDDLTLSSALGAGLV